MAAVWEQRFSRALKQVLDLRESTGLEALPDLMPVLPAFDAADPSLLRARDEILFAAPAVGLASAGNYRLITLQCNSADTLAIVSRIVIANKSASAYDVNIDMKSELRTNVHKYGLPRDSRERQALSQSFCVVEVNAAAENEAPSVGTITIPAGGTYTLEEPILLTNVEGLCLEPNAVNVAINVTFFWSERRLSLSER